MIKRTNIIKEITCNKCGWNQSKVFYCIGRSGKQECGECAKCGALTYQIWLDKNNSSISSSDTHTVTCPYCNSTNCKKISTASKIGKVAMWGVLAAGSVGHTWHCNSCGSNFG